MAADFYRKDFWQMGTVEAERRADLALALGATGVAYMINTEGDRGVTYSTSPRTREGLSDAIRACHARGLAATATLWLDGASEEQVKGWADELASLPTPPDFLEMDLEGVFKARVGDPVRFVEWLDRWWGPTGLPCLCTTLGYPTPKTIPPAVWCATRGNGGGVRPQSYSVETSKGHGRTQGERPGVLQPECVRRWSQHVPKDAIWLGVDCYGAEPFGEDVRGAMVKTLDSGGVKNVVLWSLEAIEGSGEAARIRREVIASRTASPSLASRLKVGRFVPGGALMSARTAAWLAGGAAAAAAAKMGGVI